MNEEFKVGDEVAYFFKSILLNGVGIVGGVKYSPSFGNIYYVRVESRHEVHAYFVPDGEDYSIVEKGTHRIFLEKDLKHHD